MPVAPDPTEIYRRAVDEGDRRLSATGLELLAAGFNAGFTVVFGIAALAVVHALTEPTLGAEAARLAGALGFGIGVVFLVVSRAELFTENFFDPVATAIDRGDRSTWTALGKLWSVTLVLNLVGGCLMDAIFSVEGTLPSGAHHALVSVAEDIVGKSSLATFTRGIAAGTLLTLLSYLLHAVDTVGSRISVTYIAGFILALGAFDHVVVSALHLLFGVWLGGDVAYADVGRNILLSGAGNLLGGLVLMTLTHTAQVKGARPDSS